MNKLIFAFLLFIQVSACMANIDPGTESNSIDKPDRAHLVRLITDTLTVTQATILRDTLEGLSLEDLDGIGKDVDGYEELMWGLENRSPDDEDEHGANE